MLCAACPGNRVNVLCVDLHADPMREIGSSAATSHRGGWVARAVGLVDRVWVVWLIEGL